MALIPWKDKGGAYDPFMDMERLRGQMNNLFNLSLSKWLDPVQDEEPGLSWGPALDLYDKKNEIVVKAEIPGIKKNEIDLVLEDGVLTIRGEKKTEEKKDADGLIKRELFYGSFQRSLQLPSEVDEKKVKASYRDGVLEIVLPKKESAKQKQLKIDIGE